MQFSAGLASATGNKFHTLVNAPSTAALVPAWTGGPGVLHGTNGAAGTITVIKNTLNQGLGGHLRPRYSESSGYFLLRNHYRANGSTNDVNPFLDLPDSPVHFVH